MASVEKFRHSDVLTILHHCERTVLHSKNQEIQREKSSLNDSLLPERLMTDFNYYQHRKEQLYCYNRENVVTLAGWIVTLPKYVLPEQQERFFQVVYQFLSQRYGEENVVQAIVHFDESQPHLHFNFIPVAPDLKHGGEKICAAQVLNRKELRSFHPDLQAYLNKNGIYAAVQTGITKRQGGNKSVRLLKELRDKERSIQR